MDLPVTFDRRELDQILRLYGRMVAANEWRDYAIDQLRRPRRLLRVPPHQRDAALPDRQEPETGAQAGRLVGGRGTRPDPEARP